MNNLIAVSMLAAIFAPAAPALAQDDSTPSEPKFIVRAGAAYLRWSESAIVGVGGAAVPGGNARLSNSKGVTFDIAYFVHPNISIALGLGIPPTTTLSGAGTLESTGRLAKIMYGPAVVSVRYHYKGLGPVQPYLGAGASYTMIFDNKDLLLKKFGVTDAVAPVLQAGVDIALTKRFGVYFDAKKIFAQSHAKYLLPTAAGDVPGTAKVVLDPLILGTGISFRF